MLNELLERELQNTSINDVSLADYVKENYVPVSVLEQIRAEIDRLHYHPKLDFIKNDEVVEMALDIIDKYKENNDDNN